MIINTFSDFKNFVDQNKDIKRCIIRCDLNLPSNIEDLSRVYAVKDTILEIIEMGLSVVLISHYKRPKAEEAWSKKYSLASIVENVSTVIGQDVYFEPRSVFDMDPNSASSGVTLFENLRFYPGETENSDKLAERLAMFGDIYINDAFSVSHRAHASVCAITKYLPAFAGKAIQKEIDGLSMVTSTIDRPFTAIIGGSKVSSKIEVLRQISKTADNLIISGAMANTFLAASGADMKKSLVEPEQFENATNIMHESNAKIILPVDFLASEDINSPGGNYDISDIPENFACFDIGKKSTAEILTVLSASKTVLWNGALGAFEFANFDASSRIVTEHIAQQTRSMGLVSVIGGGETVASIGARKSDMTFVSTAGGAFLEFIAGYELPGLQALSFK